MFNRKPVLNIIEQEFYDELSKPCQKLVVKAEKGDFKVLVQVVKGFIYGKDGFPCNVSLGLRYLQYGAEQKNAESLKLFGRYLLQGEILECDENQAIEILNESATKTKNPEVKVELCELMLSKVTYDVNGSNYSINFPLIKQMYKDAAEYGHLNALTKYGLICMKEISNKYGSIERDYIEAYNCLKTAAEKGDGEAMVNFGVFLENGLSQVPYDKNEAKKWYKKAYDLRHLDGYAMYGLTLINNDFGPTDEPEGYRLIKYSADHNSLFGLRVYSSILLHGYLCAQKDVGKSYEFIKKAADQGDPESIAIVGQYYQVGLYVQKNGYTAIKYFEMALKFGSFNASKFLGDIYSQSDSGVSQNSSLATSYYKIAADIGVKRSFFLYCYQLLKGDDALKNIYEIRKYLEIGRQLKDTSAMILLGDLYMDGGLWPVNKTFGSQLIREAADLGDEDAIDEIIDMYDNGAHGFAKNPREAQKYKDIRDNAKSQCCLLI